MDGVGDSIRRAMESGRPSRLPQGVLTARDIMATKLICFRPTQTIGEAIELLLKHRISGAPVLDGEGGLIGMLSEADCMRNLAASRFHSEVDPRSQPVADLMTTKILSVTADTDIYTIADRFLRDKLRRMPVLQGRELVGQVSRRDVLRAMQQM